MSDDGGSAFPGNPSKDVYANLGISKLEFFAAAALMGNEETK